MENECDNSDSSLSGSNSSSRADLDRIDADGGGEELARDDATRGASYKKSKQPADPELERLQKVDGFVQQLPFFAKVKANAFASFEEIKANLAETLATNEYRPGLVHWTNRLVTFINEYGLFFTKEDHLKLINIYINLMLVPNLDLSVVDLCLGILNELLKKYDKLTREDLVIEWRPIYDLYLKITNINDCSSILPPENIEQQGFHNFIKYARIYFNVEATQEILNELRPIMCPFDMSMTKAFERYNLFLPTLVGELEADRSFRLWIFEFMNLWTTLNSKQYWEPYFIQMCSRLSEDTIGLIDWTPYIPHIFSNLLRGFGLPFSTKDSILLGMGNSTASGAVNNNMSQLFVYSTQNINSMAHWIVNMIGCGRGESDEMVSDDESSRDLCMVHIRRLFELLRSFFYPSNTGSWSSNICGFLRALPDYFIRRIKKERKDRNKWYNKSIKECKTIRDEDIREFVESLKEAAFTAIFSKSSQNDTKKAFQYLSFLRSDIMLPSIIEKIYGSVNSLVEPHRYTSLLSCLSLVSRQLPLYNAEHAEQTQMHVIPLLSAVLPGLDPNDSNKCILTAKFLSELMGSIVLCDCSPALSIRDDLSEYEKELCIQTSKFEDFVHEFLQRLFNYIDILASDTSADSSASAAAASLQFTYNSRNKNVEENLSLAHIINTIKILIRQSSKAILKLIIKKTQDYLSGSTFNARAGRVLANLIGFLTLTDYKQEAFVIFFKYVYENLSKFKQNDKHYEAFLSDERGDIEVTWNLQLFAELMKTDGAIIADNMDRIGAIISWFRASVHRETIGYLSSAFRNIIASQVNMNPTDMRSVNYSIVFDDEQEFFKKHLPIRDWSRAGDLFDLNIRYHIPSAKELNNATQFVHEQLTQSINFLNESILLKRRKTDDQKITKEENFRELTFINNLMYASSRLLKRPFEGRTMVTDHVESSVKIGYEDTVDKGLGFELINLVDEARFNDPSNIYYGLTEENRQILLNMRLTLIEFIMKLAEKLIEENSNDTKLLMTITRILSTTTSTYGLFATDFEKTLKNHYANKNLMHNKLLGKKSSYRDEIIRRVMLQYEFRSFHLHTVLNDVDIRVIDILFRMSTDSIYAVVRKDAQTQLFQLLSHYPLSYLIVFPKLVALLNRSSAQNEADKLTHDQLKGCLYLLRGNNVQESLMVKENWQVLQSVWPALFKCQHFEKPSIQDLLNKIYAKINKDFDSFDNSIKLDKKFIRLLYDLNPALAQKYKFNYTDNVNEVDEDDRKRLASFFAKSASDTQIIANLMTQLIEIARESQLLWKNQAASLGSVMFLINPCELNKKILTKDYVQLFVDSLVHENANVRKIAIDGLCVILKMVKYKKSTRTSLTREVIDQQAKLVAVPSPDDVATNRPQPGFRADNSWHFYYPNYLESCTAPSAADQAKWDSTIFMDKTYWGYYCWPEKLCVVSNKRKYYSFDEASMEVADEDEDENREYRNAIKAIKERFQNDAEFVKKFIELATIEESKGEEKFDNKQFYLFKCLFRNFGSADVVNNLFEHLASLIKDKQEKTYECSQKLASEIVAGLIRGSKFWSLDKLKDLWSRLKVLFDLVFENITNETLGLWYSCFSKISEDQDPRRMTFYLNYFYELAKRIFATPNENGKKTDESTNAPTSFQQSSCLYLISAFSQYEWRMPAFWASLFDSFVVNMAHPYKTIREKNATCLTLSLVDEINFRVALDKNIFVGSAAAKDENPMQRMSQFIGYIEANLSKSIELFDIFNEDGTVSEANGGEAQKASAVDIRKDKEHMSAVNFLQSLMNFFSFYMMKADQPLNKETLRLLTYMCNVDKIAAQDESIKLQLSVLRTFFSISNMDKASSNIFVDELSKVVKFKSWHSRLAAIQMLQNYGIFNTFLVDSKQRETIKEIIINGLIDEQLEVRLASCLALTGLIHSYFISVDDNLIRHFKKLSTIKARNKDKETGKFTINMPNLIKRHGGLLGLCAIVSSCPYDVPAYLPDTVTYLCEFINDPVPIQGSIKKCLSEFRRTHYDNWQEHKLQFNPSQLETINDVLISPSYYA